MSNIIPIPKIPIGVRPATLDDLAFIDALQKKHSKQLGFFPRAQIEGYIQNGWMLIAEDAGSGEQLGYCASRDRYLKRDELGAIFQLCISDRAQRKLVGAALIKSVFARASYGCKLFCLWCAQDLEANRFWEAMGFVPLAFRAGSAKKARVHIFWEKRIREGDTTTPWWFPANTTGGSIREDRLVLPIPPGVKWGDEMPRILPSESGVERGMGVSPMSLPLERRMHGRDARATLKAQPRPSTYGISRSKLHFAVPKPSAPPRDKRPRENKKAVKNDPKLVAAARELRDRWLERVNEDPAMLNGVSQGKYDVSRQIAATVNVRQTPLLNAA